MIFDSFFIIDSAKTKGGDTPSDVRRVMLSHRVQSVRKKQIAAAELAAASKALAESQKGPRIAPATTFEEPPYAIPLVHK